MALRREDRSAGAAAYSKESWHAVRIVPGEMGCSVVLKLGNTRFLGSEAPELPLGGCSYPRYCKCTYTHFPDRRATAPRRWADRSGLPLSRAKEERRQDRGRRRTDVE